MASPSLYIVAPNGVPLMRITDSKIVRAASAAAINNARNEALSEPDRIARALRLLDVTELENSITRYINL